MHIKGLWFIVPVPFKWQAAFNHLEKGLDAYFTFGYVTKLPGQISLYQIVHMGCDKGVTAAISVFPLFFSWNSKTKESMSMNISISVFKTYNPDQK